MCNILCMENIRERVLNFVDRHKIGPNSVNMDVLTTYFLKEMEVGLGKKESSLAMIPTYVSCDVNVKAGDKVIVLDAGGTNFRTCLVTFDKDKKPIISKFKKVSMPGIEKEVSKKEFFSLLADQVERLVGETDKFGFCFSYAADIDENCDGRPIVFSKEIKASEVIGEKVGENLLNELKSRGHDLSKAKITVINDTVATLLAAIAKADRPYSSYLGFILGTGTNTAYTEEAKNILKVKNYNKESMIINVESGGLDYHIGDLDKAFFETTKNSKVYHFEKMISGAYLGGFADFVIKQAIKEGLFSSSFKERYEKEDKLNTKTASNFLEQSYNKDYQLVRCVNGNNDDAYALHIILDSIIARAAKLTAVNISATILKTKDGKNPLLPVCVNADGTTLYKTENLYEYTLMYLKEFLEDKNARFTKFVKIDDAPVLGAAIAGLSR